MTDVDHIRLGSLLVNIGVLNHDDLEGAMRIASELDLPLGKVLVMANIVSSELLEIAIQVQSMLREQTISNETAMSALSLCKDKKVPLKAALAQAGWTEPATSQATKLGDLLTASELISPATLKVAMLAAADTQLPLGRILVHHAVVPERVILVALTAQISLRDGKITRDQAIGAIKAAHRRYVVSGTIAGYDAGANQKTNFSGKKLGELLSEAAILTKSQLTRALELSLIEEKPLGQILIGCGFITEKLLSTALSLQKMVNNEEVAPSETSKILQIAVGCDRPLGDILSELKISYAPKTSVLRLGELLRLVGCLTESQLDEALELRRTDKIMLGQALLRLGFVDQQTLEYALRCQSVMSHGLLKAEQAIITFNYCQRMRCLFDVALEELGWLAGPGSSLTNYSDETESVVGSSRHAPPALVPAEKAIDSQPRIVQRSFNAASIKRSNVERSNKALPDDSNWLTYKAFGEQASRNGQHKVAKTQWQAAIEELKANGSDKAHLAYALESLSHTLVALGEHSHAESLLKQCRELNEAELGRSQ